MSKSNDYLPVLWSILEQSQQNEEKLTAILMSADKKTIIEFHKEFGRASANLWAVADQSDVFATKEGEDEISEDTMKDIFAYAVSKGKKYFDRMLKQPDELPKEIDPGDVPALWVPGKVFWERFQEEIMSA